MTPVSWKKLGLRRWYSVVEAAKAQSSSIAACIVFNSSKPRRRFVARLSRTTAVEEMG
jgi:hypothetical protein